MASLLQLLADPGFATGLGCISGTGYRDAGLPELPYPFIWEYQTDRNLPCSNVNAWLPALDIVRIQRETDPTLLDNLVTMGKLAISLFTSTYPTGFVSFYQDAVAKQQQQEAIAVKVETTTDLLQSQYEAAHPYQEAPMFDDLLGGVGDFFSDFSFGDYLPSSDTFSSLVQIASPIAGAFLAPSGSSLAPQPMSSGGVAQPVMSSVPAVVARAAAAGLPRWSALLPNLWQAVRSKFPMMSPTKAVNGLLSLLQKYGPTSLASFIGAAAVNELLQYKVTHKRRRMNVCNTKALRRSMRRLKGFNRLSHRVSAQLGVRRSSRRGACSTCRKSPCRC